MKIYLLVITIIITSVQFAQVNNQWENVPEDIRSTKAFQRYEWFYRSRLNENGIYPKEYISQQKKTEINKVKTIIQKGNRLQTTSDYWTNIGPKSINMSSSFISHWGSVSGRIRGIAVHPTNPNIVYVGVAAGGIWKTIDGGTNWSDMSRDLNILTFGAIAIDPNNPNTIYAGTGEARWWFNTTTFEGNGLYKSVDGGISWTHITNGFGTQTQFADIEVSPHNSNILLAALGSGNWNLGSLSNEGVWRSEDAGLTWVKVNNNSDAFDVAFDPISSNIAYSASGNHNINGGFFKSTDSGENWTQSNSGLPSADKIGRIQFSISPSSPSTIYSLIYNNSNFPSGYRTVAYKSTNSGDSWSQISSGNNIAGSYDGSTVDDQGSYDLCLDVNPTDADNVFFGNVELSKTTNGSSINFVRVPPANGAWKAPMHVDIHKIVYAPSNSNYIYVGCDGGIYSSIDGGATWVHQNNNISTLQFYNVASDPNNENILFGGAQDNGNFSTSDKGVTDWNFETSGDGMECFVDYNNSDRIFISTQNGNLYRSTNGGSTWQTILGTGSNTAWVAPYWQHPTNPNYIYTGRSQRIYRSTNGGTNWTSISSAITTNRITSVAQSKVNTDYMMAVASRFTTSPNVYKSTNEGFNWTTITTNITSSGFSGAIIKKAIADPIDSDVFYLCRSSYSIGQLIKTTDFGLTWTDISSNLPKVPHNDLFIDPLNTNHLYVANDFGVYWSNNGGADWNKLSNGMPFVPVLDFDFYVNGTTRLLRAASHGRGVFELQIDTPLQKIYIDLKVFLEGPYSSPNMNTDLNVPSIQPYNTDPWYYSGTEIASIGDDIVDWILVEMRTGATPSTATTIEARKAALLKDDGTIVDADGFTPVNFDLPSGNYYIVIYHRNHLPIMSPTAITLN